MQIAFTNPDPVFGLIFDLDDTLYLQGTWLSGAWRRVAATAAADYGVDEEALAVALRRIAAEGSDQGGIIDRGLAAVDRADVPVKPLVAAFLSHQPEELPYLPGVPEMLDDLRTAGIRVGVVTDGALPTQESKVAALRLADHVDEIVMSDALGRQYRKPHPRPILEAVKRIGVPADHVVMIGDRPGKDVAAAAAAGVRAIRVHSGEYSDAPDHPFGWRSESDAVQAVLGLKRDGLLTPLPGPNTAE